MISFIFGVSLLHFVISSLRVPIFTTIDALEDGQYLALCGLSYRVEELSDYTFQEHMNHTITEDEQYNCKVYKHTNEIISNGKAIMFVYPLERPSLVHVVCIRRSNMNSFPNFTQSVLSKLLNEIDWKPDSKSRFDWVVNVVNGSHEEEQSLVCTEINEARMSSSPIESQTRYIVETPNLIELVANSRTLIQEQKLVLGKISSKPFNWNRKESIHWNTGAFGALWSSDCDFEGHDYRNVHSTGPQCGNHCYLDEKCTHFTYNNYQNGTCYLKNGISNTTKPATKDHTFICGYIDKRVNPTTKGSTQRHNRLFDGYLLLILVAVFIFVFFCLRKIWKCFLKTKKRNVRRGYDELPVPMENMKDIHEAIDDLKYSPLYEISENNLEITAELGGGCYGNVYQGQLDISRQWNTKFSINRSDNKIAVAVKMVCGTKTDGHKLIADKMLMDELKIMCAVGSHPNVVTLVGAITINNLYVIVEMCENNNLKKYLAKNKAHFIPQYQEHWIEAELERHGYKRQKDSVSPEIKLASGYREPIDKEKWEKTLKTGLTTSHLLSFGMQIAQGMQFLHSRKCIHRDLAARNVLVTARGICKVSDFGLAKKLDLKDYYRLKSDKYLPLRWMAPEAVDHATPMSDVWSFGIVLFEIFSLGVKPYPNIDSEELVEFINRGGQCEKPNYCHSAIYEYMKKCWKIVPENRPTFSTAIELLEGHLFISSKKLLIDLRRNISFEWERQKKIANLRTKSTSSSHYIFSEPQKAHQMDNHDQDSMGYEKAINKV